MNNNIILSCEHASFAIPKAYHFLFTNKKKLLSSHEGWDIGALTVFEKIKQTYHFSGLAGQYSRLLIDLNRSQKNPKIFSSFTHGLNKEIKEELFQNIYLPYRSTIETWIADRIKAKQRVVHISIHTFTPVLQKKIRPNDIGFLYDPNRPLEKKICTEWKKILMTINPDYIIRMNYPYKGNSDGLTRFLRNRFNQHDYIGIELEINQRHFSLLGVCQTKILEDINNSIIYITNKSYAARPSA